MSVTIICPFCGAKGELDEFQEGAKVKCPSCGENFVLDRFSICQEDESTQSPASQELEKDASAEPDSHPKAIETPAPKGEQPKAESKDDKENAAPVAVPISGNAAAEIKLLKSLVIVMAILMGIMCLLMMNINSKLEALSPKDNPIVETKLINYTWDMPYTMESEFSTAVREGFEPAGYVCQNGIRGGFFLFVKRRK